MADPDSRHDDLGLIRLTDAECWAFLASHTLGRVGLVDFEEALIFPVNYVLDGQSVVFRTASGTKLGSAWGNRPVVFEVDEASADFETGTSVMVHGTLVEVRDETELARLEALPLRSWAPGARDHFVRVEPRSLSGRRIPGPE